MKGIQIQWLGHSCFKLTEGQNSIVLDPYNDMAGYPPLRVKGSKVLCSHSHGDHNFIQAVRPLPWAGEEPVVTAIPSFHDASGGAERGENTIHKIVWNGLTIVHLGDLGHAPDESQLAQIQSCDVLMAPVGGAFTIDAATAAQIAVKAGARVVIPMHYQIKYGLPIIATRDEFLYYAGKSYSVNRLDTDAFTVDESTPKGVYVPKYADPLWGKKTKLAEHITPVPVSKLIPRTKESYPFGAADHQMSPKDLSQYGYLEEEYQISGTANVYEWYDEGRTPAVRAGGVPYCSRILVVKPKSAARFSGNVVVEVMNWAARFDSPVCAWGHCWDSFLRRGDIWIGVTARGAAVQALKRFDPKRYQELSFANPTPEKCLKQANSYGPTSPDTENSLVMDFISQVGALLKSGSANNPVKGYALKSVIISGATGGDLSLYAAAIHPYARLAGGKPIYDGYMIFMTGAPGSINQEEPKLSCFDERCKLHVDVPMIRANSTGDMLGSGGHPDWSMLQRREDSDAPGDRYRSYEFAGMGVGSTRCRQNCPDLPDMQKAVEKLNEWANYKLQKDEFPTRYFVRALFVLIQDWVNEGKVPPRGPILETVGEYPDTAFVLDAAGNVEGGIRSPYVDYPRFKYDPSGGFEPLGEKYRYGGFATKAEYLKAFRAGIDDLVKQGFILEADVAEIMELAEAAE